MRNPRSESISESEDLYNDLLNGLKTAFQRSDLNEEKSKIKPKLFNLYQTVRQEICNVIGRMKRIEMENKILSEELEKVEKKLKEVETNDREIFKKKDEEILKLKRQLEIHNETSSKSSNKNWSSQDQQVQSLDGSHSASLSKVSTSFVREVEEDLNDVDLDSSILFDTKTHSQEDCSHCCRKEKLKIVPNFKEELVEYESMLTNLSLESCKYSQQSFLGRRRDRYSQKSSRCRLEKSDTCSLKNALLAPKLQRNIPNTSSTGSSSLVKSSLESKSRIISENSSINEPSYSSKDSYFDSNTRRMTKNSSSVESYSSMNSSLESIRRRNNENSPSLESFSSINSSFESRRRRDIENYSFEEASIQDKHFLLSTSEYDKRPRSKFSRYETSRRPQNHFYESDELEESFLEHNC